MRNVHYILALLRPQNHVWAPLMKKIYYPAIMPTTLTNRWTDRPLNWLDPEGEPYGTFHPHCLLSFPYWRTTRTEFEPSVFVMGDWGGYAIATQGIIVPPRACLNWQMATCAMGFAVDHPPKHCANKPPPEEGHKANYSNCLNETLINVEMALPLYEKARAEGSAFALWGVAHGANVHELGNWFDEVRNIYPFDDADEGWGLKLPGRKTPMKAARWMRFVQDRRLRRVHFFQDGGPKIMAVMLALGPPAGLEWWSTDSTSPITSGINRVLITLAKDGLGFGPSIQERFLETDGEDRGARDWMLKHCRCQSCEWLKEDYADHPGLLDDAAFDEYVKYRICYHDTLAQLRLFDNLRRAAEDDPEALLREKLGPDYDRTMTAFDGIATTIK